MNDLKVEIIDDLECCRNLWGKFSPNLSLFDAWDYRFAFFTNYKYDLYFVLLKDGSRDVGLLPLWYIPARKKYYWFGDVGDDFHWTEDNYFWVKDSKYLKPLLDFCPKPAVLNNLKADFIESIKDDERITKGNPKQIFSLKSLNSPDDYLATLKKKLRSNLKRDKNKVESLNPKIVFNNFSDFQKLVEFNAGRFLDSPFRDERLIQTFVDIIETGQRDCEYQSRMISVKIKGEVVGVDLNFIFKDIYYPLLCGNDVDACPGIGNYLTLLDMEDALSLKMNLMDLTESDENSYKEKLFTTIPQFTFKV